MKEKRDCSDIHIITDASVKFKIKADAAAARLSISEYCLNMIRKGKVESPISKEELKLLRDIANVGNNLNQISKKLNQLNSDKITLAVAQQSIQKINEILNSFKS